ncbi:hypothetical protein A7976_07895 [Methylobacillus sp. MM3]|nr:hypothetical protein A7976_07895 [Methylobacillus sp. MM3]
MIAFLPIEYLANECDHVILGSLFNILFFFKGLMEIRHLPLLGKWSQVQPSLVLTHLPRG